MLIPSQYVQKPNQKSIYYFTSYKADITKAFLRGFIRVEFLYGKLFRTKIIDSMFIVYPKIPNEKA